MARTRQRMFMQQSSIRENLSKLKMSGAAFALPPEVARSLEHVVGGMGTRSRAPFSAGGSNRGKNNFHLVSMRSSVGQIRWGFRAGGGAHLPP
jgi:hypothetical protein